MRVSKKALYKHVTHLASKVDETRADLTRGDKYLDNKIAKLSREVRHLKEQTPNWSKGFTSDSIAAQTNIDALKKLWKQLGVESHTAAMVKIGALQMDRTNLTSIVKERDRKIERLEEINTSHINNIRRLHRAAEKEQEKPKLKVKEKVVSKKQRKIGELKKENAKQATIILRLEGRLGIATVY